MSSLANGRAMDSTLAFTAAAGRKRGEPSARDKARAAARARRRPGNNKENGRGGAAAAASAAPAAASAAPTPSRRSPPSFSSRPSAKLDRRRTNNPFATSSSRERSKFAQAYADGAVPCRINHGGVKHQLQWDVPPQDLDYTQMLPVFAHGLSETRHPYVFVAQHGFTQLLTAPDAPGKVVSVLPGVIKPLRAALGSRDKEVAKNALQAVHLLSNVVKGALNAHLPQLLIPIKRRCFDRSFQDVIQDLLGAVEENGGDVALRAIKRKVPTYQSIHAF